MLLWPVHMDIISSLPAPSYCSGQVYMDIAAFRAAGHVYPKLEPWKAKATESEMEESEVSYTLILVAVLLVSRVR